MLVFFVIHYPDSSRNSSGSNSECLRDKGWLLVEWLDVVCRAITGNRNEYVKLICKAIDNNNSSCRKIYEEKRKKENIKNVK